MRGLFTAGLMDVFMEEGIRFDGVVGVSAGATFGCNYKSHQPGRVLRYNMRFRRDPRYMGLWSLLTTGDLVGAEFSYHHLPTQLDIFDFQAYEEDPSQFHVVCTDALTGKPVYKRLDHMDHEGLDWLRASASMPIVSRPVHVGGYQLLDGGISDSIPLKYFQEQGFNRCVVILTQPAGFRKQRTSLMPLFHLLMRKYPAITQAMGRRHLMYNDQLDYLQEQLDRGEIIVIQPSAPLPIGRTEQNPTKMQHIYDMGRQAAHENMNKVREFLALP